MRHLTDQDVWLKPEGCDYLELFHIYKQDIFTHNVSMSGSIKRVNLPTSNDKITINNAPNPRAGWKNKIAKEIQTNGRLNPKDDYGDMSKEIVATLGDGSNK